MGEEGGGKRDPCHRPSEVPPPRPQLKEALLALASYIAMGPRWKKEEEEDDRGCFLCFLLSSLLAAPHSPPLAAAADGPKGGGRRGALETWYPLPLYYHPSPFPLDLLLLLLLFAAAFCLPFPPFQLVRPSSEKEEGKGDGRRTGKKEPSWIAFFSLTRTRRWRRKRLQRRRSQPPPPTPSSQWRKWRK